MIYTLEKAQMITEQLRRFTTGYAHHVVGQFANLDFWLKEVHEAQHTIDQYRHRFDKMALAQEDWIAEHNTKIVDYCAICQGTCEFSDGSPPRPVRTSASKLVEARKQLVNAAYYFLVRCYNTGLLSNQELRQKCDFIDTSIDPTDLKR